VATSLGGVEIPLDYSTRDYEGYRNDILALAPTLTPEWTDFYPDDIGVVLAEMFAYIGDNLSYYIARAANETYLSTATQRRSVINLGRLMGYELSPATSAIVEMTVTTDAGGLIPAGSQVSTDPTLTGESAVTFESVADYTAGGAGDHQFDFVQGSTVSEALGSGGGLPFQSFTLSSRPLSLDPSGTSSLKVYVYESGGPNPPGPPGAGWVQYIEVNNFLSSEPTDAHYVVRINEYDIATVTFGNGVNGKIVAGGTDNVAAIYRIGGGADSNSIGEGTIVKDLTGLSFVTGVTNGTNTPQGGEDKETIEDAQVNIPGSLQALERAVTHADYEALAGLVGGVAQAKAAWGIGPYEEVVYIAATGSNPIASGTWDPVAESGTGLIGQVGDYLKVRKASPIRLVVRPPAPAPIEVVLDIEVHPGFFQSDARAEAESTLLATTGALRMGEDMVLSEFLCPVERLASIRKVTVSVFRRQATAVLTNPDPFYAGTFPDTSWAVTIADAQDYQAFILTSEVQPTVQEVLTVSFISPTEFNVVGSVTGPQSATGVLGAEWTNDLGNVTLLATPGAISDYNGVKYRITVGSGAVVSHVFVGEYEIATLALADITIESITGGIK